MSSNIWESVPDIADDGRLLNPYRTEGPPNEPGVTWDEFFRRQHGKARTEGEPDLDDDDESFDIVITQPAEEFDEPCGPLATYVRDAHKNGWTIHTLAHALSFERGKPYKGGARAGQMRPDKHRDLQWLFIEKEGVGRAVIAYCVTNGKIEPAMGRRSFNGKKMSDADMKAVIKEAA